MELYILDDLLRRETVIDQFESLIWTERFFTAGDCELVIQSTRGFRTLFQVDTVLAVNTSHRMMAIETVENKKDSDGQLNLHITCVSYETLLKNRVAKEGLTPLTNVSKGVTTVTVASPTVVAKSNHNLLTGDSVYLTTTGALPDGLVAGTTYFVIKVNSSTFRLALNADDAIAGVAINTTGTQSGVHTLWWVSNGKWRLTGTPGDIIRTIFQKICVNGIVNAGDIIPFFALDSTIPSGLFPADTILEPTEEYTVDVDIDTVYAIVTQMCEVYDLGFRIVRAPETPPYTEPELFFEVYAGSDRTTLQTDVPAVIFSPELDNLSETTELSSNAKEKNVAYVFGKNGAEIVYAEGYSAETVGLNRKVLMVKANDIDLAPGPELTAALQQKGKEELSKNRSLFAFDGKIPQFGSYRYMVDYNLGDLVEMRNGDGVTNNMRVTEQITIQDSEGERSYPTLATELLITPGSWLSWSANKVWDDFDAEVWADMT